MDKKIETAIENVEMIKAVIAKTQKDFSKISNFFLWIGVINVIIFIVEQFSYYIRNVMGYSSSINMVLSSVLYFMPLLSYCSLYFIYYKKMKEQHNDISIGMLKTWGIILIGSQIFSVIYTLLLPGGNSLTLDLMWRSKELIIIMPILTVLFMTGIITKSKLITIVTTILTLVYFMMFTSLKEMAYGAIGGVGTRISVSSFIIRIIMTLGMIALSIYLKKRS